MERRARNVTRSQAPEQSSAPPSPPTTLTPQHIQRWNGLLSRIPHPWAFFGGLAIEMADFTFLALVIEDRNNGQSLASTNPFLDVLSIFIFLFIIILLAVLVTLTMITMAYLKRWGWFIGLLLGSIAGTGIIILPGLALIVFGLAAPRTPPGLQRLLQ